MKETLILLHGALGSKNQFNALKERLEDTYNVHAINFEGHGGEPASHDFSIALFTQSVIDYITAHKLDEVTIFGHSMGGYVALNVALKMPQKVKKIWTLGTKFQWDLASAEKEVKLLNPTKVKEKVPQFADKLMQAHHPQDWESIMHKTAEMMLNMANGARLKDDDFKQIDTEVVIGLGSLDNMVTEEESAYISKLLPNAKLVQLENVKHPIDQIETEILVNYIRSN